MVPEYYPGIEKQPLFDYMDAQYGIVMLESEMEEILEIYGKILSIKNYNPNK